MFVIERGHPLPFGVEKESDGVNFAIFSQSATRCSISLFDTNEETLLEEIELDPRYNKTGNVWHIKINWVPDEFGYAFSFDGPPSKNAWFDFDKLLLDPYATLIKDRTIWGVDTGFCKNNKGKFPDRIAMVSEYEGFDWDGDIHPDIPMESTVIYELHIRGYTIDESAGVSHKGTFLGLCEKIPYLQELGITAVELMPVFEFEENDSDRYNPDTGEKLLNFWGYNPINFFTAKTSYATNHDSLQVANEFKEMVKRFHRAGIEVILDVVFNHTAEGNCKGCTYSYRGIDNAVYYILDKESCDYTNYSGCGNTLNCNHPVVREMILDSLRFWVAEMHVDGFRFDLASILGRGREGEVLKNPPLLEHIANDPVLAKTKLIAEAWDAGGLYQVGSFPSWGRFAEWNGKFRDHVRSFLKSDEGMVYDALQRFLGSNDIYRHSGRGSNHSINFITAHDGFTLHDLTAYNEKHNLANGEDNRDGDNTNHSWNCGAEGETDNLEVLHLRRNQQKNFMTFLLLSRGVPMILGGDEFLRTQQGNNNAYCQDNAISWVDWELVDKNGDFFGFVKKLIDFRKKVPMLRGLSSKGTAKSVIHVHGRKLDTLDVGKDSRYFAIHVECDEGEITDYYFAANMHWEAKSFELPAPTKGSWGRVIDTNKSSPEDFLDTPEPVSGEMIDLAPRSIVVLINR